MIRFYYHLDPDSLDDDMWCKLVQEVAFVLDYTGQTQDKKQAQQVQTHLNKFK